ncbi:winged helix-turn-helix domain-containing protein [Zymomonas mobilis]|uniref:winged helix-turn-helix domain-containing protein n=1 Tax=Zymomonas mobilis TaxID=542 RepID=UPI00078552CA|nr:hypothetical protein LB319_09730 [Zymomonas mobilis]
MLPVLRLAAVGEQRVADAANALRTISASVPMSAKKCCPAGDRLLHNRIHWAKFYMSKTGLVALPKQGR